MFTHERIYDLLNKWSNLHLVRGKKGLHVAVLIGNASGIGTGSSISMKSNGSSTAMGSQMSNP